MNVLYISFEAFMFLLGVFLGYKTRSGLPESKDMNNESVICFCVISHNKHSDSKQPPFYLLINFVGQQFRLSSGRQFFAVFSWVHTCGCSHLGSSTRIRWPNITSFMCLAVGAGCRPDPFSTWSVLLKDYPGFITYQSHNSKRAKIEASRGLNLILTHCHIYLILVKACHKAILDKEYRALLY